MAITPWQQRIDQLREFGKVDVALDELQWVAQAVYFAFARLVGEQSIFRALRVAGMVLEAKKRYAVRGGVFRGALKNAEVRENKRLHLSLRF